MQEQLFQQYIGFEVNFQAENLKASHNLKFYYDVKLIISGSNVFCCDCRFSFDKLKHIKT